MTPTPNSSAVPQICGNEDKAHEAMHRSVPVYANTNLKLDSITSTFAVALHMHQPLIPTGGPNIQSADLISNLEHMFKTGDDYNAGVFADCYGRMGDIVPGLVKDGRNPRAMLDYSGELFYGLKRMGREDVFARLKPLLNEYKNNVEWLGTMWGHAVASSTPVPDLKLHMLAWQQEFAAHFGWDALSRVRGFSPPEMHMPNHPDVAYEYVKALKECGYKWLLVQEHTVEACEGSNFNDKHIPYRLEAKNSKGEVASIVALIKTQGSDTKLVAQMQPLSEARGQSRRTIGGVSIPAIVSQIGDGENGGVMMNEFPSGYRGAFSGVGTTGTVGINGTEYLELLEGAGLKESMLPAIRPIHQGFVLSKISSWGEGAADRAIAEIKKSQPHFNMDGGSWTNNISWVKGYENVLTPMNELSAKFHQAVDGKNIDPNDPRYKTALFYLLAAETSCFRYWGQGAWTDYAREICRRGAESLKAFL